MKEIPQAEQDGLLLSFPKVRKTMSQSSLIVAVVQSHQ